MARLSDRFGLSFQALLRPPVGIVGLSVVFTSDLVKALPNQYTQSVMATVAGHQN